MSFPCYIEGITRAYHAAIATAQEIEEEQEAARWWESLYDTERPSDVLPGLHGSNK